ncbi:MAG: histidine triad nucleotide-binding protein [Deltaproteobacteria bacterium]|nr:histidine triad nucleotide-binding protein [Deltaproteobacteria bacterium]
MAEDCIFCKIVSGDSPSTRVYEDEKVLAFEDIHPMAPVHVVVVPKRHIPTLLDCTDDRRDDLAAVMSVVQEVAKRKGIDQSGFRTVINCNAEGGQLIFHLHAHVLGGKKLADEMG